jgi:DNA replication protein DnaC
MKEKYKAILPILLKKLFLTTIARQWEDLAFQADNEGWGCTRFLATLCEMESIERDKRRIERHTKESQLPIGKSLATFDFSCLPDLNKAQIHAYASGDLWIREGSNILVFGPSGTGKTHLSSAIGQGLIENGYRVLFTRTSELIQKLQAAKRDLSLPSALDKLDKFDCLILDDFGYVQRDSLETSVLFELISDRYERKSLIVTCNQPFGEWDKIFVDKTMAVAAIDRLIHRAIILELNEESYRKKAALTQKNNKEVGCA